MWQLATGQLRQLQYIVVITDRDRQRDKHGATHYPRQAAKDAANHFVLVLRFLFSETGTSALGKILVRGSMPPCRLRRRKFRKYDYEIVHSEV